MQYGQLSAQSNRFKVSKNSAFKPYVKFNPYNTFMDIIESGEIKIATRNNEILTPAEAIMLFDTMKVRYQNGVIKIVSN
jgi:hypothetical protein